MAKKNPGTPKPFDLSTRQLIEADPLAWLHFVGLPGRSATLIDANLATVEAEADRLFQVSDPDYLVHLELQANYDAEMSERMLLYNVLGFYRHRVPVESVLLLLREEADGAKISGQVAYGQMVFGYRIVRVWEHTAEEFLNAPLALVPLAPLTPLPETEVPAVVQRMRQRIEQEASMGERGRLFTAAYLLMGLKYNSEFMRQLLQGVREMKESSTYQLILQEGRAEGEQKGRVEGRVEGVRESLLWLGSNRFGPPDPAIRAQLEAITDASEIWRLFERTTSVESWQELLQP